MAEFFAMGGYAGFVWPAYGISALVLGGLVVSSIRGHARAREQVRQLESSRKAGA